MTLRRSNAITIVTLTIILPAISLLVARVKGESPATKVTLTPDQLKWAPVASLLPGAQSAVILGAPDKPGPHVYRVKFPPDFRVQAHSHLEDRTYTVLSGTFYLGLGEKFDETKLMARPAGSFYAYVAGETHFGATKGEEVVLQITSSEGSTALKYVNPADDPRTNQK
ncbi:MAG: cupin domain-containing protein [Acidobacteriota bacterium]|jgi:quercetin dioxygenase-like cupin family protein